MGEGGRGGGGGTGQEEEASFSCDLLVQLS